MSEQTCSGDIPRAIEGTSYAHRSSSARSAGRSTLYAFGGATRSGTLVNETFAMDCETLEWKRLETNGTPPSPRMGAAIAIVEDERLFVHGGAGEPNAYLSDAFELDLETLAWREVDLVGRAPSARAFHTVNALSKMLVCFGGDDGTEFKRETHYMRYDDNVWREPETAGYRDDDSDDVIWPCERACHTATALRDGDTLILFGGLGKNNKSLGDTWAWSASELCWTPVEPPSQTPEERFMHTSTIVGDGLVILGGMTLHMSGVDSGKKYSVFDHMYILTGMQLLTHPTWRAEDGTNGSLSLPGDARKKFSLTYPERVHPKKKLAAEIVKQTAADATPTVDETNDGSSLKDERETSPAKVDPPAVESTMFPSSAPREDPKKTAPAKKASEKGRKQKPAAAPKNEASHAPVDSSSKKGTTKETTTETSERGVAASSPSKPPQIPLPSVKLAPPDDAEEDELTQETDTDAPDDGALVAPPKSSLLTSSPVAEASTFEVPGAKSTSTKISGDDAGIGKSTPSPPKIPSPTVKLAKEEVRSKIPGVRLAPLHEDDWEEMDMYERVPSFNTSSDQEHPGDSPESNPYEWVTSEDNKFNILRNYKTGVEIRRIPIPECMQEEEAARFAKRKKANVPIVAPQPPPQAPPPQALPSPAPRPPQAEVTPTVKKPVDELTDIERLSIAQKLFETLEVTNFNEQYAALHPAQRARKLEIAWRALPDEERAEWVDMTRGPPSSRKRRQAAREGEQKESPMIGSYASGIVTGVFDRGYFATLRLEDDDQPRDYRAVLFPVKRESTADDARARARLDAMLD